MANEKFSQFAVGGNLQPGDIVVGLRAGANTQFNASNTVSNTIYESCRLVSITQLNATYNNGAAGVGATLTENVNGALIVDSFPANAGDRILVVGQSNSAEDGIYVVTQTGSAGTPYILTRATDFDTPSKIIVGGFLTIFDGFDYLSSIWVVLLPVAVIGTSNIVLSSTMDQALIRFGFLQSANDLSDVANPLTAFDNISPVNTKGAVLGFTGLVSSELSPGTNGQVLTADNTQTVGFKWDTPTSGFAFTAKGQLITYDGTSVQYENVGADTFVLTADSAQANGIKWAPPPNGLNFTAKGQLITYDGSLIQYLNVGTDGFVLVADSTQLDGIKWAASPPVTFANPNCIVFTDNTNVATTNTSLQYEQANNQIIQDTAPGSITGQNVATFAATNTNLTINFAFVGAASNTSISASNSAIIASNAATIAPLGNTSFIAAADTAFMNTNVLKSVILGSNGGTISVAAANCGVICTSSSTVGGGQSVAIGGNGHNIVGLRNTIIGGDTNSITGGVNCFIAGGANNVGNGDHNFIAAADSSSANGTACVLFGDDITCSTLHAFAFNDGVNPITPNIPNSFSVVATRGMSVGGTTPGLSDSIRLESTNKALRLNNVSGTGTITNVAAGHVLFDTTTNQFMGYNGTAWVILG